MKKYARDVEKRNYVWKALAEIYTMHAFAPFSDLEILVKFYMFV